MVNTEAQRSLILYLDAAHHDRAPDNETFRFIFRLDRFVVIAAEDGIHSADDCPVRRNLDHDATPHRKYLKGRLVRRRDVGGAKIDLAATHDGGSVTATEIGGVVAAHD